MKNTSKLNTQTFTRVSLLCAILVLMSLTPLGYLKVGVFSITFLTIPVLVGAVMFGAKVGALLGLVFGITSLINAHSDPTGTFLISISWINTAILCIVPRVLEGFLCGCFYKLLNKNKSDNPVCITIASLSCPLLNTVLYLSALILLFGNTPYFADVNSAGKNLFAYMVAIVGVQALIEAAVCTVVGALVTISLFKFFKAKK